MPRATVTVQATTRAGIVPTFTALASGAGNGAQFAYDQTKRTEIRIRNGGTAAATVTFLFNDNAVIDGQAPADPSSSVAAGATMSFKPLNEYYRQTDGNCYVECSAAVDIALVRYDAT